MSKDAVTLADIASADWSLCLDLFAGGQPGAGIGQVVEGTDDIEQCIAIILMTPLGSDPFRPTFGLDQGLYIDVPLQQVAASLVGPAKAAIETWEPRITVESISITQAADNIGHITVSVTWALIANPSQPFTTQITL